jgi:hypothetical protein
LEPDPFVVALEVGAALERLGVPFHLGGSLASSIHGIPRATLDADLVADLKRGQGAGLCELLGDAFYKDVEAVETAIASESCFNVIHLQTLFKVDVFIRRQTPFGRESFDRSQPIRIAQVRFPVRVATAEDTVLHKLLWYRQGGEVSDRQWLDVVGVLKVCGRAIDCRYLERWAAELGLEKLLARARSEADPAAERGGARP